MLESNCFIMLCSCGTANVGTRDYVALTPPTDQTFDSALSPVSSRQLYRRPPCYLRFNSSHTPPNSCHDLVPTQAPSHPLLYATSTHAARHKGGSRALSGLRGVAPIPRLVSLYWNLRRLGSAHSGGPVRSMPSVGAHPDSRISATTGSLREGSFGENSMRGDRQGDVVSMA